MKGQRKRPQRRKGLLLGGIHRGLPDVVFKRHRSPMALLQEFFNGMGVRAEEVLETPEMLESIQEMGVWAFVDNPRKKTPHIHYWIGADTSPIRSAYVLGHEVGHISGRKLKSERNAWREELRADEYGAAAFLAMEQVLQVRRRTR